MVQTQGDALSRRDSPITHDELLGKVAFIMRKGKRVKPARSLRFPNAASRLYFDVRTSLPVSLWAYTACDLSPSIKSASNVPSSTFIGSRSPLPELTAEVERLSLVIEIGGMPVA